MKFKEFLTSKEITEEQYEAMDAKEVSKLHSEYQDEIAEKLKAAFEEFKKDNDLKEVTIQFDTMSKAILDQGEVLAKLETAGGPVKGDFKTNLRKGLEKNKETLKGLKDNRHGSVRIELKAVADMLVSTHVSGQIPQAEREAGITRIVVRQPFLAELVNTGTIGSTTWEWVEQKTPEGGAAMTAEGAAKSQADFNLVLASATVRKVTSYIKASKEMLDDIPLMESEINQELTQLINLEIDSQILSGDGTGQNLTGILENAVAFAAGSFAGAVDEANNQDVLRIAANQIMVAQFQPNIILMHPSDVAAMDVAKASDGHYVLPPFSTNGNTVIKGIPIVQNTGVTEGDYLIGDFTKSGVRFKEGLTIDVGFENDDFTKNFITILAESRLVHRVKSNHYNLRTMPGFFPVSTSHLKELKSQRISYHTTNVNYAYNRPNIL
jgi:HK97 family phage major capsid protein